MIRKTVAIALLAASMSAPVFAQSALDTKAVRYELDGTKFSGSIIHHATSDKPRPGILMVPNWMGPTDAALEKAKQIAGDKYVVMVVDMYGVDTRPANAGEAGAAASKVRADRNMMRGRATKALEVFRTEGKALGLDTRQIAAIGYCFGGGAVLELGRAGADVDAIISFHGDLASPTLEKDAAKTKAKVLVCHGADDPYVSPQDVQQWEVAMRATTVDWQLIQYSGTVHSFTDSDAASDGARYNERSCKRAYQSMAQLLGEVWGG